MKIFIIEDDEKLKNELQVLLENNDYQVLSSTNYSNITKEVLASECDLLILDLNLPITDGFSICKQIRKTSQLPILVVTSRSSEIDELISLNMGADDFISKPYNSHILLAHIQSILRRFTTSEIVYKGITFIPEASKLVFNEKTVELTNNENKILRLLMKNKGSIVSRDDIMNELWQTNQFIDDNTLTVNMNRLRHKLEEAGIFNFLETKRGQGYLVWVY